MLLPGTRVSFYAIERIQQGAYWGGAKDGDFDPGILPFDLGNGISVEDVTSLIPDGEFETYKNGMGSYLYEHLEQLKYALVHRFPEFEVEAENTLIPQAVQVERSRCKVRETAACLRLIRPTVQHLHFFEGRIGENGMFSDVGMEAPRKSFFVPINQQQFGFRTKDAYTLRRLLPLFHSAMAGEFSKFRMAVQMHESGCLLTENWKAQFFLWTAALEALYTTQANQGSVVASERIKFLLGANTSIYPPGDLASIYPDPNLTVTDVVGEIYYLRNHIAHGDKVPDCYFQKQGRPSGPYGVDSISQPEMLFEALSFIIRHSLMKILDDELIDHFQDKVTADAYFGLRLTKKALQGAKIEMPTCTA